MMTTAVAIKCKELWHIQLHHHTMYTCKSSSSNKLPMNEPSEWVTDNDDDDQRPPDPEKWPKKKKWK